MSIDLAMSNLNTEIAERKREALKGVVSEVLDCFAVQGVPVSEFLVLLNAALHERSKGQHRAWTDCELALEKAFDSAAIAEQAGQFERAWGDR